MDDSVFVGVESLEELNESGGSILSFTTPWRTATGSPAASTGRRSAAGLPTARSPTCHATPWRTTTGPPTHHAAVWRTTTRSPTHHAAAWTTGLPTHHTTGWSAPVSTARSVSRPILSGKLHCRKQNPNKGDLG